MPEALATLSLDSEQCKLVDEAGELQRWYQEIKPRLDRLDDLKSSFRELAEKLPADQAIRGEGGQYFVDLTMREEKRNITSKAKAYAALVKAMGAEKLKEALTYTFKLLDAHVPEEDQKKFVTEARTGSRDVSFVKKAA